MPSVSQMWNASYFSNRRWNNWERSKTSNKREQRIKYKTNHAWSLRNKTTSEKVYKAVGNV